MALDIVILAAGQGKRMYSRTPKVLHCIGGKPMLLHVIETALSLRPHAVHVVIGHGGERIQQAFAALPVHWVIQAEQLGTGHAVLQALPSINPAHHVLVLSGDVPLIKGETLSALVAQHHLVDQPALALLLAVVDNPVGLGRVVRNTKGEIESIVEEKDATDTERAIQEIYTGICCASASHLMQWLPQLGNQNAQKEYYLTNIISMAAQAHLPMVSTHVKDPHEIQGVNNRLELQQLERAFQKRMTTALMLAGVGLADAARVDIRGALYCGQDVFIDINTVFEGTVTMGDGCRIGANCHLTNVTLGDYCEILPNSVLDNTQIGHYAQIGPFARLRPGTVLADHCKIGNFVETKNAKFGHHSKANHLTYLGDATIGHDVNIGAGTITCNYDGMNKHQTIIEDGAFIGSDTQLVAPVVIGKHATIGAGSTIRKNAPAGELTLTHSKQTTIEGWVRPVKKTV